jgi:hypothetical protein
MLKVPKLKVEGLKGSQELKVEGLKVENAPSATLRYQTSLLTFNLQPPHNLHRPTRPMRVVCAFW